MEPKKLEVDHQRMSATLSLKEEQPLVVIADQRDARAFQLPDYGELTVKVHEGRVSFVDITEKHKY